MSENERIQRILDIRKKYMKQKSAALKSMNSGNLKEYLEKLTEASKLKQEFSETLTPKN